VLTPPPEWASVMSDEGWEPLAKSLATHPQWDFLARPPDAVDGAPCLESFPEVSGFLERKAGGGR